MKDVQRYAEELGIKLNLEHPGPIVNTKEDEVGNQKIGEWAKKAVQSRQKEKIEE